MNRATGFRRLIAPLSVAIMLGSLYSAQAQEITASHLAAARAAIAAIKATDVFDTILPDAAQNLKAELIQKDPNLESIISNAVDDQALALAARRVDLENEAARAYAVSFSEEELNAITGFYNSPAGKKLLSEGPIATREVMKAATIWRGGIARDLAQAVAEKVVAAAAATAPAVAPAPAAEEPAPAAAPAPAAPAKPAKPAKPTPPAKPAAPAAPKP